MNHTDLLALQTKITHLKKQTREVASRVKYHSQELKDLKSGKMDVALSWDREYVARNTARHTEELARTEALLADLQTKVAALEATRPEVNRYTEILEGLKGNTLEVARNAIEIVIASEEMGTWIPHGSRKVHGLVDKKGSGENWKAFREAVAALDEKRNQAVFIVDPTKVSPTIRKTLDGMNLDSTTIRVCPIEYREVEFHFESKLVKMMMAFLVWPEGTKHRTSRFGKWADQCHACGHAIRNAFNWVPVLVDSKDGVPHSMWVGRDCAKTLFGIELRGALRLAEGQR